MTKSDLEAEYQAAKAAYGIALARLKAAKVARPHEPSHHERLAEMRETVWQAYIEGERDRKKLAEMFNRPLGYINGVINRERERRNYGPPSYLSGELPHWRFPTPEEEREAIADIWRSHNASS